MTRRCQEEERFLVLAPTGRDGSLTCALLEKAGMSASVCASMEQLCVEAARGVAGLLIAEEVLVPAGVKQLVELIARQEAWSDLPILIFTGEGATIQARRPTMQLLTPLGNVTLLDRPLRPVTMLSATQAALRARRRQYEAREELSRQQLAVRQRDQFLAMLGHELRNPLGVILLAAEMLGRGGDIARQREVIQRQGRHLTRLVEDLLDVARVTSGKIALQRQPIELNDLMHRCVESAQPAARAQHLEMSLRGAGAAVVVEGDAVRLEQVFGNLIANAVKYTPPGGRVAVTIESSDDEAVVTVWDNGLGISAEMVPRVFDLFAQAEGTLDRAQGGLGIGLTLVRSLVELHGGKVNVTSGGPGLGSEFAIRLPLPAAASAGVELADVEEPRDAGRGCRVLIVEDNSDTREMLATLLETFGHTVEVAASGTEGVERAVAVRPDVLLVDIGLPGMDGYAVAREVRASLGGDVLMVALTGYGQPEDRRRALESGFDVHYPKPVDADRLRRLLSAPKRGIEA